MKIKITVEHRHDSADAIRRMKDRLVRAARDGTTDILHAVERQAKINTVAVFRHPMGRLAGSIRVSPIRNENGGWTGRVGPTVVYGRIQELGGPISPKGHPFLAFFWAEAPPGMRRLPDGRVLARHVTIRKHPYLKPAVDELKPAMPWLMRDALTRALNS